jgi:hypothetical protein
MYTDETNSSPSANTKFFVYGGLIVPMPNLERLHSTIERIRRDAGYRPTDTLKFDTRARPEYVERELCTAAKQQVIESCLALGCKFIAYVIHHAILKNQDARTTVTWAADHVFGRFNVFLQEASATGICAVDSLPVDKQFAYLSEKFCGGLTLDDGSRVDLSRIILFSATTMNASHASSAMDIVLGSFRYAINDPQNKVAAAEMMKNVARLMWHKEREGEKYLGERGLIFRPKEVKSDRIRAEYDQLKSYIGDLIKDA